MTDSSRIHERQALSNVYTCRHEAGILTFVPISYHSRFGSISSYMFLRDCFFVRALEKIRQRRFVLMRSMSFEPLVFLWLCVSPCFTAVKALPDCNYQGCEFCLFDAKEVRNASNLVFEDIPGLFNQTYESPLRIASPLAYWDSFSVEAQILGILAREYLGLNVTFVNIWDESQSILALMNCPGWFDYNESGCAHPPRTLADAQAMTDDCS